MRKGMRDLGKGKEDRRSKQKRGSEQRGWRGRKSGEERGEEKEEKSQVN